MVCANCIGNDMSKENGAPKKVSTLPHSQSITTNT